MSTLTLDKQADTLWICVDCYYARHGIADELDYTPDREPLNLISADAELSAGMMAEEHACGYTGADGTEHWQECECEHDTFSWSPCDGCGSTLGGAREALTIWSTGQDQ